VTLSLWVTAIVATIGGALIGFYNRKLWHEHKWVEVTRTFVAPLSESTVFGLGLNQQERALHSTGFTTVLFQCERCAAQWCERMPGQVHTPKLAPLHIVKSKGPYA
jgi:hypothetical protein